MALSLLERAKRQIEEPRPSTAKTTTTDEYAMADPRDPTESWRRLTLRVLWVLAAARATSTIDGFATKEAEGSSKKKKPGAVMRLVTWEQIIGRPQLSSSRSKAPFANNPASCTHEMINNRSNQAASWFTCMMCGTRWPRDIREMLDRKSLPGAT
jgi:hypothetical protein